MKRLFSLVLALGLVGCHPQIKHRTTPILAPSVGEVKGNISRARESNNRLKSHLDSSSDYSDAIDAKTIKALEYWNQK